MDHDDWVKEFEKDKRLIGEFDQAVADALHTVRRYVNSDGRFFETAVTYTGRLVVREGVVGSDGIAIHWMPWKTMHDIGVKKQK